MDHLVGPRYIQVEMVCIAPLNGIVNGVKIWCFTVIFKQPVIAVSSTYLIVRLFPPVGDMSLVKVTTRKADSTQRWGARVLTEICAECPVGVLTH